MLAVNVKPEYGPTLPELVQSRVVRLPGHLRGGLIAVALAVVVVAGIVITRGGASVLSVRAGSTSFGFSYESMRREATPPGQFALLAARRGSRLIARIEVGPLDLPAYTGFMSGLEPVVAANAIRSLAAHTPGFVLQSEGPTSVNGLAGYNFTYTRPLDGATYFGRVILLTPQYSADRRGLTIAMLAEPVLEGVIGPGRAALAGALYEPGQGGVGVLFQPAGLLSMPLATFHLND
jgi:hypothetical protein